MTGFRIGSKSEQIVLAHLRDPDLHAESIGELLGVSGAYVRAVAYRAGIRLPTKDPMRSRRLDKTAAELRLEAALLYKRADRLVKLAEEKERAATKDG